jgi:hypothetical protein
MSKPGADPASGISLGDVLRLPKRHLACRPARSSIRLLYGNVRTWPAMPREKAQAAPTARPKVPMRRRGAEVIAVELGPTGSYREEPEGSAEGGSLRAVTRAG